MGSFRIRIPHSRNIFRNCVFRETEEFSKRGRNEIERGFLPAEPFTGLVEALVQSNIERRRVLKNPESTPDPPL